jgi:hypothetical protein
MKGVGKKCTLHLNGIFGAKMPAPDIFVSLAITAILGLRFPSLNMKQIYICLEHVMNTFIGY